MSAKVISIMSTPSPIIPSSFSDKGISHQCGHHTSDRLLEDKTCEEKPGHQDLGMMTIDVGPTIVTKKLLVSKNILSADIIQNSP